MRAPRGAILLEVLVSLAIVVGVSAFTIRALDDAAEGLDRADRRRRCMDAAVSVVSMLETGMIGIGALRSSTLPDLDGMPLEFGSARPLRLGVETERTVWGGVVLLNVTVEEEADQGEVAAAATLRQLVRLRAHREENMGEDDLMRGLP